MIIPMIVLATACAVIGLVPPIVAPILSPVLRQWNRGGHGSLAQETLAPLAALTPLTLLLAACGSILYLWSRSKALRPAAQLVPTWDCGYAKPTRRMQYTASSFANMLVRLFGRLLRPHEHEPKVDGAFPSVTRFDSHVDDVVLDRYLMPFWNRFRARLSGLRALQQGSIQSYVLYILITLAVLLLLAMPWREVLRSLMGAGAF